MKPKIRVGLIGCGSWMERAHLPLLGAQHDVTIAAIAEPVPAIRAYSVAARYGVPAIFSGMKEMIESIELDAVIISTPHALHFRQVAAALRAGLHVHVDKPLAETPGEVAELRSLAHERQRILSLHTQKKYQQGILLLKRLLRYRFREIYHVSCETRQPVFPDFSGSWRQDETLAPGGFWGDSGWHCIDTALHLLREGPLQPLTEIDHLEHKQDDERRRGSLLLFLCGSTSVKVRAIRGPLNSEKIEVYQVDGDGGTLRLSYRGGLSPSCHLRFTPPDGSPSAQRAVSLNGEYKTYPLRLFLNAVRGEQRARETLRQNLDLAQATADILSQARPSTSRQQVAV